MVCSENPLNYYVMLMPNIRWMPQLTYIYQSFKGSPMSLLFKSLTHYKIIFKCTIQNHQYIV